MGKGSRSGAPPTVTETGAASWTGWRAPRIPDTPQAELASGAALSTQYYLPTSPSPSPSSGRGGGGGAVAQNDVHPVAVAVADRVASASLAVAAHFGEQLLRCYRQRLVEGVPTRAVWAGRVLYVIAEEPAPDTLAACNSRSSDGTAGTGGEAYNLLGRYASLLLAVEQKLAASRFHCMARLFCPSEFAFAAGCCYANTFRHTASATTATSEEEVSRVSFRVYGPPPDPTKSQTLWGALVAACPFAERCVVSAEQRVLGAQALYRRTSWLASPQYMTGAAIQLSKETAGSTEAAAVAASMTAAPAAPSVTAHEERERESGVDVVLLAQTMKLEELPQAAALALPVKTF